MVFAPIAETAVLSPVDPAAAPPAAPTAETPSWPQAPAPATASAPPYVASGQALPAHDPAPVAADGDESESADTSTSTPRRKAWLIPLVIVGFAVLYVGAQALVSSTVPRGTEAVGIDIGGMSAVQAQGEIDSRASELATAEIEMNAAEQSFALPAADAGLDIDAEATIAQVTGFTVMPDRLWAHITGGGELEPVIAVDDASLADALETAATQLDGPSQDAGVTVSDGAVEVVPGRSSITVDQQASAALIADVWPSSLTIDLIAEVTPPAITDEDAQTFARQLESQTFAAPITLIGDDAEATIEPATIATHSTVVAGPSGLMLEVDGEGLAGAIIESNPDLTTDGENASVSFDDNHKIVIDEGKPGITIDADELGTAVTAAAANLDRIGELPYTAADPEVSAEDLGLADFKEVVSTFDTPLTSEWVRTENLRVSAQAITGMVLQPGDNFDLVDALSPINEESGYRPSGVIVNGILTTGMGGGLSQMATTAFNVGYFAGYELIEHRPHSVWLTRYPAGRESTMYTGSINVVFKNNTPYAAIINSYVDGGRLYVDLWSTKHFDVTTAESPRSNVRQPGVKEVTSANCSAKSAGQPGFTITNTRTVMLEGDEFSKDSFTWTYKPDDAIRCVSPNTPDDDDDDED